MRRDRGFSLLELGIVIAVGAIFAAAAAATAAGFYQTARSARTGNELAGLATAGANALKRQLVVSVAPGTSGPNYSYTLGGVPITATAPQCYDLHSGICPTTNAAGPGSFVPAGYPAPQPVSATLIAMMTANSTSIYNNGYNAWCEPYVICLFPARADVLTCIPNSSLNSAGLESTASCGACAGTPNPVTNEATSCVMASASALTKSGANFSYAYSDYTYILGAGSQLPASFGQGQAQPCSPPNCK